MASTGSRAWRVAPPNLADLPTPMSCIKVTKRGTVGYAYSVLGLQQTLALYREFTAFMRLFNAKQVLTFYTGRPGYPPSPDMICPGQGWASQPHVSTLHMP